MAQWRTTSLSEWQRVLLVARICGIVMAGAAVAAVIVALSPLLLVYVVWTNWKDYTL